MKDFDILYGGNIIGNLKADTAAKANKVAKKMFAAGKNGTLVVVPVDCTPEQFHAAKTVSKVAPA